MNGVVMWIRDGAIVARPQKENGTDFQDKTLLDQFGMVCITSGATGTLVQWNMGCPNWASLMLASKLLPACSAPFKLKYFNAGWFTEIISDIEAATDRMDALIFKSDVRLSDRAYTAVVIPELAIVPQDLQAALKTGHAPDHKSIVCLIDTANDGCQVENVGRDSLIARIWGVSPNSYPCLNGHSYDRAVTPEYFRVIETGRPHYDHVLASMVRPNGELHWLAYQRVILPDGRKRVRVISELAPVKIQLL